MTDLAAAEFRQPSRYVRLDTILRLRWLAVLGQIAADPGSAAGVSAGASAASVISGSLGYRKRKRKALRPFGLFVIAAMGG